MNWCPAIKASQPREGSHRSVEIEVLKPPPVDEMLGLKSLVIRAANHVELNEASTATEILKLAPLKKRTLDDNLKQVHLILAVAYEKTGQKAHALKHLRLIYAADPGFMNVGKRNTAISRTLTTLLGLSSRGLVCDGCVIIAHGANLAPVPRALCPAVVVDFEKRWKRSGRHPRRPMP